MKPIFDFEIAWLWRTIDEYGWDSASDLVKLITFQSAARYWKENGKGEVG